MARPAETFNIVILGEMNPSIHHAVWYQFAGLIAEEEATAALGRPTSFSTPPASQVDLGAFVIACQEQLWEIKTHRREEIPRIQDIASRVFDKVLLHTPVTAIGFNFNYVRSIARPAAVRLGELLGPKLQVETNGAAAVDFVIRRQEDSRLTQMVVRSLENTDDLEVRNNFEYRFTIRNPNEFGWLDLASVIASHYSDDHATSVSQTDAVISAVDSSDD